MVRRHCVIVKKLLVSVIKISDSCICGVMQLKAMYTEGDEIMYQHRNYGIKNRSWRYRGWFTYLDQVRTDRFQEI